jgi:hypothetical protein
MDHTEYRYIWSARPENKVATSLLQFYENRGFWAQTKKNGTNTLIHACGDEVLFKTRHPDIDDGNHRQWTPNEEHKKFFSGSKGWNVFNAELLHNKTPHIKNELYIFDVYVLDGCSLAGKTFAERQQLLHDMFSGTDEGDQVRLHKHITLAKCFDDEFKSRFDHLKPEDEGLVLKDPEAVLRPCHRADSNKGWQVKVRIPHKNYTF